MNLNFLNENIIKICNEIEGQQLNKSILYDGIHIPKALFENETYQKTINKLLKNEELTKSLSKTIIIGTLNKLIKNHVANPKNSIKESVENFKKINGNIKNYKVYVPLLGIELFSDNLKFSENISILKVDNNKIQNYIPSIGDELEAYPTLLEVNTYTADFEKAMEISIEVAKYIICFLRLVDYNGWDDEDISIRIPGYGGVKEGLRVYAVDNDKKNGHTSWQNKKEGIESLELDDMTIEDMNKLGLEYFSKILDNFLESKLSDLQHSILRSIIWFGESKVEIDDAARFIKLMLVIECLLNSNDSDPITATLRDRTAFLLAQNIPDRINIAKKVTTLYTQRSKIVHHGKSKIELKDLLNLENLAADIIVEFLTKEDLIKLQDKKNLHQYFEELKYYTI